MFVLQHSAQESSETNVKIDWASKVENLKINAINQEPKDNNNPTVYLDWSQKYGP